MLQTKPKVMQRLKRCMSVDQFFIFYTLILNAFFHHFLVIEKLLKDLQKMKSDESESESEANKSSVTILSSKKSQKRTLCG
ncbi:CLUMA_CG004369, isoform A [Clunio marinus]|uniref:CLUMA_CG004369, isoform A n=1 Tax=Clunio marinus TaxID=568069 RepID=A0A1J1HTF9_9DIPT|nr:CLUMA_CG004369, isoform A [Clunio marinus]